MAGPNNAFSIDPRDAHIRLTTTPPDHAAGSASLLRTEPDSVLAAALAVARASGSARNSIPPQPAAERTATAAAQAGAAEQEERSRPALVPPVVTGVEDTGLEGAFITDLLLKMIYYRGVVSGGDLAVAVGLPYSGLVENLLEAAKQSRFVEVLGAGGLLSNTYKYVLSDKGHHKVQELLERSTYAGVCPVTIDDYNYMVGRQRVRDAKVTRAVVEDRFSEMVLSPQVLEQLGPAINSGESIFVFGAPGNGKTTIAEIATTCLGGDVYIPYAIYFEGEIIRVFDDSIHHPVEDDAVDVDRRWVRCKRPTVIAGGELTLQGLDLTYSPISKVYEAPLQMKANCGMFLIDDFGRQQCSPAALLNRWIVPLEKHVDYLNLVTGTKIKIPFEELIVFSTNLSPKDLVDDAFLRRLQYKIEVLPPTPEQFQAIFQRVAAGKGVQWDEEGYAYLMREHYAAAGRQPQACHPRDLLNHLLSMSRYYDVPARMTPQLLGMAARSYFVRLT